MSNSNDSRILAADIGGTNVRLVLATPAGEMLVASHYASHDYDGMEPIVERFLSEHGRPEIAAACVAIAGPVEEGDAGQRARVTNLPWVIESSAIAARLGGARTRLINDFQAVGLGIEALRPEELVTLQAGRPTARGPRALIGAGTGLGQGVLVYSHDHYEPIPTEGGHADFAPADDEQWALACELRARHGHVSWERLVSGGGLEAIYEFLARRAGRPAAHDAAAEITQAAALVKTGSDSINRAAAEISEAALVNNDPVAVRALDLFARLYGAQAGNLALTIGATGGVYVAGGIAPRILDKLRDGTFMRAFLAKGRMRVLLERMPVHIVVSDDVGLRGAVRGGMRT
jgi:glucokinase